MRSCAEQLQLKDKEYQDLRQDFQLLRIKCNESEQQLNTNQNVIALLNKQINELQLKHGIKSNQTTHTSTQSSTQPIQSTLPKVNLIEKQKSKSDHKIIAQRNALFVSQTARAENLFKR